MKYLIFCFVLLPWLAIAQDPNGYDYNKNSNVKTNSEPSYPGGEMALYEYVFNKLDYPRNAVDVKATGESQINFNVNADSTLSDFSVVKEVGYGIDEELIRVLKELKFAPGTINGKAVTKNVLLSFPIEAQ